MRVLCLLLAAGSLLSLAQTPTGQITGRVSDSSDAIVPGASIEVTNTGTGLSRKASSNEAGFYTISLLPPGEYRIDIRKEGFRSVSRPATTIAVDQVARLDFRLEVGSVNESVEVLAVAPTVEAGTAALGTVVSTQQIQDLPLNSRNPLRLAYLVPGFTPSPNFSDVFNRATSFRINGGRSNMNDAFIDGVSNSPPASNGFLSYAMFPSPDALQEFKVQTNSYAAEYGRSGGGVINMVMRSGTNEFHGVGYEFLRNSVFDANNFFTNRAGAPLPSFKRNQFGFAGGGPIIRDKAFFFVNYEGLRQRQASNFSGTFPTELERRGDFSKSFKRVGAACAAQQIFDPFSTAGGTRTAFPNNVIPTVRMDPVALKVTPFLPLPTLGGDACTGANNYFVNSAEKFDVNQLDSKVDWAPTTGNRFLFGASYRKSLQVTPNFYNNIANTAFAAAGFSNVSWGGRLDYTRIQTASLIFNVRLGFSTVTQDAPPAVPQNFSLTDLGLPALLQSQIIKPVAFPNFTFAGYSAIGQNYASPLETFQTYSLAGSTTWIRGRHSMKFGLDQRLNHIGSSLKLFTSGLYNFDRAFTQGPNPNVAAANLGDSIGSFLLGAGASGNIAILPSIYTANLYSALYAQDDYKVTSHLTLNLGLRYDIETGKYDRYKQLSWFDYGAASPLAGPSGFANLKGGVRFQGVDAGSQYPTTFNNWGPRIGFAWETGRKTVIRGGYGIFYLPYVGQAAGNATGTEGFSTQTNWVTTIDNLIPENRLSNPFPTGLIFPTGSSRGLSTNLGQNMTTAIDRASIRSSYVQLWNFNIQRELPGHIVVEPAYVGSKGSRLVDSGWEMNQLTADQLAQGTALQTRVANPFLGLIPTGTLAGAQVTRAQLLRPYPQFLNITNFRPTGASSTYHAFQLRVQKQFSKGASFLVAYTTGKQIDDNEGVGTGGVDSGHQDAYYRRAERAVSPQDVSRRLVMSGAYELPFGKGKPIGSSWPGMVNQALGGWQVNGILSFGTGVPLALTAANTSNAFSSLVRPNVTGDPRLSADRPTAAKIAQWFNTAAFAQPAPFTFGNGPRTLPNVRAQGEHSLDLSLFKEFPFGEKRRVEFRAEAFNITNTPQFGLPGTGFGTATFGVISAQVNTPRQLQFAMKVYF